MSKVRDILGVDKESEFLQSFVRGGLGADLDENEIHKSVYSQSKAPIIAKQSSDIRSDYSDRSPRRSRSSPINGHIRRGRRREYYEEMYTDKDRAAAVSYGCFNLLSANFLFLSIIMSFVFYDCFTFHQLCYCCL